VCMLLVETGRRGATQFTVVECIVDRLIEFSHNKQILSDVWMSEQHVVGTRG